MRGLVEAVARLGHVGAEAGVLAAGEAAAEPEHGTPVREVVQEDDLLGDAQRVVPGQDEGARGEADALRPSCQPGEELGVVWAGGVVEEVVLDDEDLVEAQWLGQLGDPTLVRDVHVVGQLAAVVLEDELEIDVHAARRSTAPVVPGTPSQRARRGRNACGADKVAGQLDITMASVVSAPWRRPRW